MSEAAAGPDDAHAAANGMTEGPNGSTVAAPAQGAEARERVARVEVVQQPVGGDASSGEEDEEEGVEEDIEDAQILEDLPDETEDIDLNHSRLNSASVARLGLPRFREHLKRLCLRQNFITHVDPEIFGTLTNVEDLDLYDNKIKHVGTAFNNLTKLVTLDLSYNLIKHIPEDLESRLTALRTIYFVQNKISHIQHLAGFGPTLRSLELGGNRIRKIEGLDTLVNLEELWLGKNKIARLEGLETLRKLRVLSIQSNRITKIEGLETLENLEELYLSHNGVTRLEGVDTNVKLRTIDVGNNFIEKLENVSHLTSLEELWINDNKIPTLQDVEAQLKHITTLETVYLERNPVQGAEGSAYRRKIILMLPQIQQLDATYVKQPTA